MLCSRNIAATVLFPVAIPPVNPTTYIISLFDNFRGSNASRWCIMLCISEGKPTQVTSTSPDTYPNKVSGRTQVGRLVWACVRWSIRFPQSVIFVHDFMNPFHVTSAFQKRSSGYSQSATSSDDDRASWLDGIWPSQAVMIWGRKTQCGWLLAQIF